MTARLSGLPCMKVPSNRCDAQVDVGSKYRPKPRPMSYQRRRKGSRVSRVETKMHIAIAINNRELKKNAAGAGG